MGYIILTKYRAKFEANNKNSCPNNGIFKYLTYMPRMGLHIIRNNNI